MIFYFLFFFKNFLNNKKIIGNINKIPKSNSVKIIGEIGVVVILIEVVCLVIIEVVSLIDSLIYSINPI
jgi:hypothetical protein